MSVVTNDIVIVTLEKKVVVLCCLLDQSRCIRVSAILLSFFAFFFSCCWLMTARNALIIGSLSEHCVLQHGFFLFLYCDGERVSLLSLALNYHSPSSFMCGAQNQDEGSMATISTR